VLCEVWWWQDEQPVRRNKSRPVSALAALLVVLAELVFVVVECP